MHAALRFLLKMSSPAACVAATFCTLYYSTFRICVQFSRWMCVEGETDQAASRIKDLWICTIDCSQSRGFTPVPHMQAVNCRGFTPVPHMHVRNVGETINLSLSLPRWQGGPWNLWFADGDKDHLTVLVICLLPSGCSVQPCVIMALATRFRENHPTTEERLRTVENQCQGRIMNMLFNRKCRGKFRQERY
jgi:hypothetical protein